MILSILVGFAGLAVVLSVIRSATMVPNTDFSQFEPALVLGAASDKKSDPWRGKRSFHTDRDLNH